MQLLINSENESANNYIGKFKCPLFKLNQTNIDLNVIYFTIGQGQNEGWLFTLNLSSYVWLLGAPKICRVTKG